jgi:chromosome segregation ATPase
MTVNNMSNTLTPPTDGRPRIEPVPPTTCAPWHSSENTRSLAHRLAENIIEVWTCLVEPVEQAVARDHAALCTTMDAVSTDSEALRDTRADLSRLRQLADLMRKEQGDLLSRLTLNEDRLTKEAASSSLAHAEMTKLSRVQEELRQEVSRQASGALLCQEALSGVEKGVKELLDRHEALESRLVTLVSECAESNHRLRAGEEALQALAASNGALSLTCSRLQERQEGLEKRIDAQASAMRALHSNLLHFGDWLERLRTALGRVEETFRASASEALPPEI